MKKNLFYYLFAMICSVALFASCSDDDDEVTGLTHRVVMMMIKLLALLVKRHLLMPMDCN